MKELNLVQMEEINGGLTWGCWLSIGMMGVAIVGAAAATGGVGAIILGQVGLYGSSASIVAGCGG